MQRRKLILGGTLATSLAALGVGQAALQGATRRALQAPRFEVDPMWPKPLPNHWVLGWATGVTVDAQGPVGDAAARRRPGARRTRQRRAGDDRVGDQPVVPSVGDDGGVSPVEVIVPQPEVRRTNSG